MAEVAVKRAEASWLILHNVLIIPDRSIIRARYVTQALVMRLQERQVNTREFVKRLDLLGVGFYIL